MTLVYFIQARSAHGPIKIGYTGDIAGRFSHLQSASWEELFLRVALPGGRPLERALHGTFSDCRLLNEWFDGSDDVLADFTQAAFDRLMDHVEITWPSAAETLRKYGWIPDPWHKDVPRYLHGFDIALMQEWKRDNPGLASHRRRRLPSAAAGHVRPQAGREKPLWTSQPPWAWRK